MLRCAHSGMVCVAGAASEESRLSFCRTELVVEHSPDEEDEWDWDLPALSLEYDPTEQLTGGSPPTERQLDIYSSDLAPGPTASQMGQSRFMASQPNRGYISVEPNPARTYPGRIPQQKPVAENPTTPVRQMGQHSLAQQQWSHSFGNGQSSSLHAAHGRAQQQSHLHHQQRQHQYHQHQQQQQLQRQQHQSMQHQHAQHTQHSVHDHRHAQLQQHQQMPLAMQQQQQQHQHMRQAQAQQSSPAGQSGGSRHASVTPAPSDTMGLPIVKAVYLPSTTVFGHSTNMSGQMSSVPESPSGGQRRAQGRAIKAPWSRQEDQMIRDGVITRGYKWTTIAKSLPRERSADAVRNRWHRLRCKASSMARGSSRGSSRMKRRGSKSGEGEVSDPEDLPSEELSGSDATGLTALAGCELELPEEKVTTPPPPVPPPPPTLLSTLAFSRPNFSPSSHAPTALPRLQHGDMWTEEEDQVIDDGFHQHGPSWREIAQLLPGRTHSGCRNRYCPLSHCRLHGVKTAD